MNLLRPPPPIAIPGLKHLNSALNYEARVHNTATCIQRSTALAMDLNGSHMVFGTFRPGDAEERAKSPEVSTVPFIHAWVEWRGWVYAPTTLEKTRMALVPFNPVDYYRANGARDIRRVPRELFKAIVRKYELSSAFRHNRDRAGSGEVSEALLRAAGVKYRISDQRTILPAE